MTKKYLLFFLFFVATSALSQSTTLSENARVSIITIGPGAELNDSFGHNAFRITDKRLNIDIVYDYGRYNFNTPNFYLKFLRGRLLYEIGYNNFRPFFDYYKEQNRWLKEQVLDLTYPERQALFDYLQNNARPENKRYQYEFFYDNCATRMRDVLIEVLGDKLEYKDGHITENYSFRELIQKNVEANSWGSLGMDVAIGAVVDRKANPFEYQFLPEYVFKGAANAMVSREGGKVPLVKRFNFLFEAGHQETSSYFFTSPFFVFGCIGLLIVLITGKDFKDKTRSRVTDSALFVITGLAGMIFLLLWFATDHTSTANNLNLLWALPVSPFLATLIFRQRPPVWLRIYVFSLILLLVLLVILWISGVQIFAIGLSPLLVALFLRYSYLWLYLGQKVA